MEINEITNRIIASAIEVHKKLGPGLLESAYRKCLCHEIYLNGLSFENEKDLPIEYKNIHLESGYRVDIVVEKLVIVEVKAVMKIEPVHEAQLLTYLRLSRLTCGLLINFNTPVLIQGLRRVVNNYLEE
jgi:GxxExxY protein